MTCDRFVLGLFGSLFLMALFLVPCTITTSSLRTDPYSQVVTRTAYSRNSRVFLPRYLSMRSNPGEGRAVYARSFEWAAFMVIIAVLGLFDYAIFCRLLRRTRRPPGGAEPDEQKSGPAGDSSSSLSLFR